jgi:hypothetical protein
VSECNGVRDIVFSMEGDLSEIDTAITALLHAAGKFGEDRDSNGEPGDLDYFVADALTGTLAHYHRLLHEKWERLFDLTRRHKTGE